LSAAGTPAGQQKQCSKTIYYRKVLHLSVSTAPVTSRHCRQTEWQLTSLARGWCVYFSSS